VYGGVCINGGVKGMIMFGGVRLNL
jgi:hypothetical protein